MSQTHLNLLYIFFWIAVLLFPNCKEGNSEKKDSLIPINEKKQNMDKKKIIFLGDSLTAGLGIPNSQDTYVGILQEKIDQITNQYEIINAGISGDTTTGGLNRLDWVISDGVDLLVIELGANDMMRGLSTSIIESNLSEIIKKTKEFNANVKILLIPMKPFPNLGKNYGKQFENIYKNVSGKENIPMSKFLLENIAGIPDLNQKDGIHPTEEGHKIMAKNIETDLYLLIKSMDPNFNPK
jgi:acyl-CoA thioesterase I